MIQSGERVTIAVNGQTEAAQFQLVFTPAMLRSSVLAELGKDFSIDQLIIRPEGTIITGTLPWSYTAQVTLRTRGAYAHAEGIASMVAHAFYVASDSMPVVTVVRNPGVIDPLTPGIGNGDSPGVTWPTALVVVGIAVIVLAWKF